MTINEERKGITPSRHVLFAALIVISTESGEAYQKVADESGCFQRSQNKVKQSRDYGEDEELAQRYRNSLFYGRALSVAPLVLRVPLKSLFQDE
ncbi:unnamed protein product [Sphenostylis stenocarpa]|uniref:Uncharacterized protein n=1 Tax=Sphenostylis stenocarpa TaxID=92480 RepID=A0AA86S2B6_9FABA|nr:unnamed protein product [Sphenostylis stenocarpa]